MCGASNDQRINCSFKLQDWLGQNGMADYRKIEAAFQERGNIFFGKDRCPKA